jgi:hypothetical protein
MIFLAMPVGVFWGLSLKKQPGASCILLQFPRETTSD